MHTRRGLVVTISYRKQPADARSSALYSQGGLPNYRLSRVCEFIRLAKSVVPWDGIEPPTRGSSGPRSTPELPGQKKNLIIHSHTCFLINCTTQCVCYQPKSRFLCPHQDLNLGLQSCKDCTLNRCVMWAITLLNFYIFLTYNVYLIYLNFHDLVLNYGNLGKVIEDFLHNY